MDLSASEEVQVSYLNSILRKVNSTEENFKETFVKSPEYIELLSQFELKEITTKQILKWINESTKQQEKLNGIKALSAIFNIGGNDIGRCCLDKDDDEGGTLKDLMEFIEFDKEVVQESIIEMLSIACSQKQLLDKGSDVDVKANAIEGLAYASLKPTVKETITYHPTLLKEIFKLVKEQEKSNNNLSYGVTVILSNITSYKKKLSKDDQHLLKLKKMAEGGVRKGENEKLETNPLDEDEYVENRIKQIMKLGGIQSLILLSRNQSQIIRQLVSLNFLNLATNQMNRGMIVQQGGVKTLIPLAIKDGNTKEGMNFATQALAKIAITMDPNLAFRGERSSDLVRPLLNLCQGEDELSQFESLMALTNLGSVENDIRMRIYDSKGIPIIENLQFSENTLVRRAATECLCNMMFCEPVYELYSDVNKITILVALSDVEDFETRRAASGALAILSTDPNVCTMILDRPKGIQILKDLFNENSPEIQHRAIECFKNIAGSDKDKAELLVKAEVHKRMLELVKESKVESVVVTCAEALKILSNYGLLNI
ncbi:1687_t:CDS:2 [Funneliformis geosporum]|uniref:1687_t:CDS:1 n=1 Tax=Funneliformis geosporum TaxID=1117311 RepID=A0A9W4WQV3_9GLOM|nr:1687_t:CDS:2 [Funneliformis geosporum]